jgi:hypothetical protein
MEPIFVDQDSPSEIRLEQGDQLPIQPAVQTLLRRWIKERDALEHQINGVLQSLVVGHPGVWDLDESIAFMIRRAPIVGAGGQTER